MRKEMRRGSAGMCSLSFGLRLGHWAPAAVSVSMSVNHNWLSQQLKYIC